MRGDPDQQAGLEQAEGHQAGDGEAQAAILAPELFQALTLFTQLRILFLQVLVGQLQHLRGIQLFDELHFFGIPVAVQGTCLLYTSPTHET